MTDFFARRRQRTTAQIATALEGFNVAVGEYDAKADNVKRLIGEVLQKVRLEVECGVVSVMLAPERRRARWRALRWGVAFLAMAVILSMIPTTSKPATLRLLWFGLAAVVPCLMYWRQVSSTRLEHDWRGKWSAKTLSLLYAHEPHGPANDQRREAFGFDERGGTIDTDWSAWVFPSSNVKDLYLMGFEVSPKSISAQGTFVHSAQGVKKGWVGTALAIGEVAEAEVLTVMQRLQERFHDVAQALYSLVELKGAVNIADQRLRGLRARQEKADEVEACWADLAFPEALMERIIRRVEMFVEGDRNAPIGLLFEGPPGTGKTSIAKALSKTVGCEFIVTSINDYKGETNGVSERMTRDVWQRARAAAPCILFIDECESVLPKRNGHGVDSYATAITNAFINEWQGMNSGARVLVIGATNRADLLDAAADQRFQERILVGMPEAPERTRMFSRGLVLSRLSHELSQQDVETIANELGGLSGRQIGNFISYLAAETEHGRLGDCDSIIAQLRKQRGERGAQGIDRGLDWDDVVLDPAVARRLQSLAKIWRQAEAAVKSNFDIPRNVLLYGPPGTGKTQVARVMASQAGIEFIYARPADLKGAYQGHTERQVKEMFDRARTCAPALIFIDELDIVAPSRDGHSDSFSKQLLGALLQEMNGISPSGNVFIMAATNRLHDLDEALRSRFELKVEIGLPDEAARLAILHVLLKDKPVADEVMEALTGIARITEGRGGRDLSSLVSAASQEAMMRAMEQGVKLDEVRITCGDLERAHVAVMGDA